MGDKPSEAAPTGGRGRRSAARRLVRLLLRRPLALTGLVIILGLLLVALVGPQLTRYDPNLVTPRERFIAPCREHPLGTDHLGRDVMTRIVYGTRISFLVAVVIISLTAAVGTVIGAVAGYFGGYIDEVLMRITDVFMSFPWLVLAMAASTVMGPSLMTAMLAVSLVWWPGDARLIRSMVMSAKTEDYVEAAAAIGASRFKILFRHILPNCFSPLLVRMSMDAGRVILATASLSFIGLGAQPPTPEWGVMVADGRVNLFDAWWMATFPGLAIVLIVVGFNLLGDAIRDVLDPKGVYRV
ncbi:MAG: ABC transporter permease [Acetobacteraceae bacterium]|nr:ABC transporter permease [Acetobacteraceae bacterium]